jgi:DNA-binding CsgD family transcriptional regulator
MSSVRNIAAAQPYVEACEAAPEPASADPPSPPLEPWIAAFDAAIGRTDSVPFSSVWEDLVRGRLRPLREASARDRVYLVAQVIARPSGLNPDDASLVAKVLCGDARKVIASDLGIAISTATGRFLRALAKLELADRNVPLPLVLAAQSGAGVARIPSARAAFFDYDGRRCLAVCVPRAATTHLTALTRSEQEVALWLIEGVTRYAIAERRDTSAYTVARQFHSIFAALRVTGRYALIRRAVELHCFHELRVANASVAGAPIVPSNSRDVPTGPANPR